LATACVDAKLGKHFGRGSSEPRQPAERSCGSRQG
jgi:hypothetical protein